MVRCVTVLRPPSASTVVAASRVHGGDVASSWRVELADGRRVFAKTHPTAPPHFFTTEAAGLRWLGAADAVPVPAVLAVRDEQPNLLVLEWIDESRRSGSTDGEAQFGRRLAALHRHGSPVFGREDRRTTGSRGLPNEPCRTWAEFYGTQRLVPLARLAGGVLSPATVAALEALADSTRRVRRRRRAGGSTARRSVGRQSSRGRGGGELVDRSGAPTAATASSTWR